MDIKEYKFTKFEGQHCREENRITITKSSDQIGFPTKFYKDNKINSFKYVVLFWDKENKAIGIHFTNDENEKNRSSIIHSKAGYGGGVIARNFFRANEIDPKLYYGRYNWKNQNIDGVGKLFIFEIKENENTKK